MKSKTLKLKIIVASTRPGRVGLAVGQWFLEEAKKNLNFESELIDLAEVNLPLFDEPNYPIMKQYAKQHTKDWSALIEPGDAFVFVTPEYNFGFPATLKNAFDYLYREWIYKPLGFVSYGGIAAGTRSVQMMKQVVTALNMMPITESVNIPNIVDHIRDDKFQSNEKLERNSQNMLQKLFLWAKHLKELRREINSLPKT